MGVFFKLINKDGVIGRKVRKGCWGFLTHDTSYGEGTLQATAQEILDIDEDKLAEYNEEMDGYQEACSIETYIQRFSAMSMENLGLSAEELAVGIDSIIVCDLALSEGYAEAHVMYTDHAYIKSYRTPPDVIAKARWDVFDVLIAEYPALFKGITNVDREGNGEVTLTYNQHYAALYNQLRILKKIQRLRLGICNKIVKNPDLSIYILEMYWCGTHSRGDGCIFKAGNLTYTSMSLFIRNRQWCISKRDVNKRALNARVRQGCTKHHTLSYARLTQRVRQSFYSGGRYNSPIVPHNVNEFISNYRRYQDGL